MGCPAAGTAPGPAPGQRGRPWSLHHWPARSAVGQEARPGPALGAAGSATRAEPGLVRRNQPCGGTESAPGSGGAAETTCGAGDPSPTIESSKPTIRGTVSMHFFPELHEPDMILPPYSGVGFAYIWRRTTALVPPLLLPSSYSNNHNRNSASAASAAHSRTRTRSPCCRGRCVFAACMSVGRSDTETLVTGFAAWLWSHARCTLRKMPAARRSKRRGCRLRARTASLQCRRRYHGQGSEPPAPPV